MEGAQDAHALLLKTLKDFKDSKGNDLYNHIIKLFNKIITGNPSTSVDAFEELSLGIKKELETGTSVEFSKFLANKPLSVSMEQWIQTGLYKLLGVKPPKPPRKPDDPEEPPQEEAAPEQPGPLGYVPDLLSDVKMIEYAGFGFSEEYTYLLMMSQKKLAKKIEAKNIKFWGIIYGISKDYVIVEVTKEGGEEAASELPPDQEPRGSGTNQFVYYVTDSIGNDWIPLPDTSPKFIKLSRDIRHVFTGNLEEVVTTNPFFFGKEKDLLRAQIARISHSTTIIPGGRYKVTEDNLREVEQIEEPKLPSFSDLSKLEFWVHWVPSILNCARTVHMQPEAPPEGGENFDPEEELKKVQLADPFEPRLKPLNKDKAVSGHEGSWTIRVEGDKNLYQDEKSKDNIIRSLIIIESQIWPGACTIYKGDYYTSIYVGYGLKIDARKYYPIFAPIILEEPKAVIEQPEPTPLTEPKEEEVKKEEENAENKNEDKEEDNEEAEES